MNNFGLPDAYLLLVETVLKVSLVIVLAGIVANTVRRKFPSCAHLTWVVAFLAIVAVPIISAVAPWHSVLFLNLQPANVMRGQVRIAAAPDASLVASAASALGQAMTPQDASQYQAADERIAVLRSPIVIGAFFVWLVGFLAVAVRSANGLYCLRIIRRFGTLPLPEDWMSAEVDRLALHAGRSKISDVRVSATREFPVPMTWGILRPTVVLPSEATAWSRNRLEATLLHEFSHVRRYDFLTQMLAEFACAIYWFNPLVWLAARNLRSDAELAADESVLRAGLKPSDYASELLQLAADLGTRPIPFAALGTPAMTNSKIETRLESILSPTAGRRGVTTFQALIATAIAVVALPTFASLHASAQEGAPTSADERTVALSNLKQAALAVIMYATDYDNVYPYVQQTPSLVEVVQPYMKSRKVFESPTKGGRVLYNLNVGGVTMETIEFPARAPLLIESLPDPKMKPAVAFCDGHAKLISPEGMAEVKKAATYKFPRSSKSKPLPANYLIPKKPPY